MQWPRKPHAHHAESKVIVTVGADDSGALGRKWSALDANDVTGDEGAWSPRHDGLTRWATRKHPELSFRNAEKGDPLPTNVDCSEARPLEPARPALRGLDVVSMPFCKTHALPNFRLPHHKYLPQLLY